jgi:hypothetical protein
VNADEQLRLLIASWQFTVVVLLASLSIVVLFRNLRELRRT